jgi:HNH endonuclease/NUMOD4 motif-containing protein
MERWEPILGYEGRYEVSNLGRVRRARDGRVLRHHLVKSYHRASLWDGLRGSNKMVHLLVARAFLGPCPEGHEANHKDGDLDNNRISNLEYVTPSQNVRHSLDVLGVKRAQGSRHGGARLTEELVRALRAEYAQGDVTGAALARRVGVHQVTMSHMLIGRTWRHV